MRTDKNTLETTILGGGCFWCVEAVFRHVLGIQSVISGYAGGSVPNPNYKEVCKGDTGHAEVVELVFDSATISFRELLEVFFATHDPTTKNRQGNDVGTQYRSVVFYTSEAQKSIAESLIRQFDSEKIWDHPIVTEVLPAPKFYMAEEYHQDYFTKNPLQPYCAFSIPPKLEKLRKRFPGHFLGISG